MISRHFSKIPTKTEFRYKGVLYVKVTEKLAMDEKGILKVFTKKQVVKLEIENAVSYEAKQQTSGEEESDRREVSAGKQR